MHRFHILWIFVIFFCWPPAPALADCANPAGTLGSFIYNLDYHVPQFCDGTDWKSMGKVPGTGGAGCSNPAGVDGDFVYNSDYSVLQYCDGTTWKAMGAISSPPPPCGGIGGVCADGSVYAGMSPDGNVPMYTTPADAGAYTWVTADNYIDTAMVNCTTASPGGQASCQTGRANTTLLASMSNADSPYVAATYCDSLSAHGHTDWYLPAQDELNVLYTNRVAIGAFDLTGSWADGFYWSSSEGSDDGMSIYARGMQFSGGFQGDYGKGVPALKVRCVRR